MKWRIPAIIHTKIMSNNLENLHPFAEEYLSVMTKKELRYFTRAHKLVLALALILVVAVSLFLIIYNAMLSDSSGVLRESEIVELTSSRDSISAVEF